MSTVYNILNTIRSDMKSSIRTTNDYSTDPIIVNGVVPWDKADRYPVICFMLEEEPIEENIDGNTTMTGQIILYVYGFCYAGTGDSQQKPILELSDDCLYFFFNDDNSYKASTYLVEGRKYNFGVKDDTTILTFSFKVMIEYDMSIDEIKD